MKYITALYPLFVLLLLLISCQPKQEKQKPITSRISKEGRSASCPYLTTNHQGQPVLCWIEATEQEGSYLLTYATSADGGNTFETPKTIPTSAGVYPHDENMSKIVFKPNGDIMALFAVSNPNPENSYAGLVFYTQSFDNGATWTAPKQLAAASENSNDERYFDVALLPDGEIAAVWLDSRKTSAKEGSSLYYTSTKGRQGFTGEKVLDQNLCQCCRTDLYLDGQQRLHVAYRGILNDSIRDMMHLVSADNGHTFAAPERISADNWVLRGCPHTGPAMASTENKMHFAWFTMGGGSGVYYSQKPEGQPFADRLPVSTEPSARHPQLTACGKEQLAIVWDERVEQDGKQGSRIGFQIRQSNGDVIRSSFLTPAAEMAIYPVILPVSAEKLLVAYTRMKEKTCEVWWQLLPAGE